MKLSGIGSATPALSGDIGGAAAAGGLKIVHGGAGGATAAQAPQENSDLSKAVEDLLHDKLMDKMGGGSAAASPLGGSAASGALGAAQSPNFATGEGPMVQTGGLAKLKGAKQENSDLKQMLSDLLQQQGSAGAQSQSPSLGGQGGENDDLMKLLSDLLQQRSGGAQAAAPGATAGASQAGGQQQAGGLQGQNQDLMKLLEDLLQGQSSAGGADQSGGPAGITQLLQQSEQLKGLQSMMQSQAA